MHASMRTARPPPSYCRRLSTVWGRDPVPISRVSSLVVCGCVDLGGLAAPVPWRPPASARAVPQRPACERQRSNARPACPVAAPPLSRTTMAHGQLRGARATGVGVTSSQGVGVTSSCSACPREGARVRGQNYTGLPVRRTGDKGRCDIWLQCLPSQESSRPRPELPIGPPVRHGGERALHF